MRGSTSAVRARAASVTSAAETSRERTRRATSSTESSHSSGGLSGDASRIFAASLHLGNDQELAESRRRRVGQEELARQARTRPVLGLPHGKRRRGLALAGLEPLELVDVVDDVSELLGEHPFFFRRETKPGEGGDLPYFFEG